jgi:hypothetical protein
MSDSNPESSIYNRSVHGSKTVAGSSEVPIRSEYADRAVDCSRAAAYPDVVPVILVHRPDSWKQLPHAGRMWHGLAGNADPTMRAPELGAPPHFSSGRVSRSPGKDRPRFLRTPPNSGRRYNRVLGLRS